MGRLKNQNYATSCLRTMGKIGEKERTFMWENNRGGLSVLTSLGGLGAKGGAKSGPRHYEILRSSSDLRSLEGQRERGQGTPSPDSGTTDLEPLRNRCPLIYLRRQFLA